MSKDDISDWYQRYGPIVLRRARSILGDGDAAKDVLQDVFVTAISQKSALEEKGVTMSWFYKVATNRSLNKLRNTGNRRSLLRSVGSAQDDIDQTRRTAEQQTAHEAKSLLASLPEDLAEIAVYYYLDEMTQAEISSLLKCSRRNVSHKLARTKETLEAMGWAA